MTEPRSQQEQQRRIRKQDQRDRLPGHGEPVNPAAQQQQRQQQERLQRQQLQRQEQQQPRLPRQS